MKRYIIAGLVNVVAVALTAFLTVHLVRPPQVIAVHVNSTADVTEAKVKRLAATTWRDLEQREVDTITVALRKLPLQPPGVVTIFCFDEAKCGALSSSLENAFESAHASIEVRYTAGMIPPGFVVSSQLLLNALGDTGASLGATVDPTPEPGHYITIGEKPRS